MKLTNRQVQIEIIRRVARHFWALACKHEGFATDTKFAIFSDTNVAAKNYNRAMGVYFDLTAGVR